MAYTDIDKPSDYFETLLSTGDGGSQTFTGLDFQPDWVWSKRRQTHVHQLYDSVRTAGSGKALQSDSTAAEGGDGGTYGYLSSFTSDGFASTAGSSNNNYFNADGGTYVFWNWKAGTSVSGNTTGSGTAKAYSGSVSADAGFSIITYLGNGTAGHTIPHHLGVVPQMIIVKERANANSWYVYHHSLGNTKNLYLNGTHAAQTDGVWNDTTPTSSVFTLVDGAPVNRNDGTTVAYCFAEKQGYSKFGSYTGNGNADGTFISTGFKPAWIMIKATDQDGEGWFMFDNKRDVDNAVDKHLIGNANGAEASGSHAMDFVSNGIKIRNGGDGTNTSAKNYVYMAFAKNPFVTSTGVPATAR